VRSVLIAVSGMVGSGKTTTAEHVAECLRAHGVSVTVCRFQTLPCFRWLRSWRGLEQVAPPAQSVAGQSGSPRWRGYRRKRLTLALALIYAVRILVFRVYRWSWRAGECRVFNRYFFDLLVHLALEGRAERAYYCVLCRLIPLPDIAILMVARPETIAERRPTYTREYLDLVALGYDRLREDWPQLFEIRSDPGQNSVETVECIIGHEISRLPGGTAP
jgi:hypothetical protein